MNSETKTTIKIETTVKAPIEKIWTRWSEPEHITKWAFASDDWQCPKAENDLRVGGKFSSRMEAKDGSMGFDFGGTYDVVEKNKRIAYTLGDGRKVDTHFNEDGTHTTITQSFEAENQNPIEMQRGGWQMILENFRKYAEG